MNFVLCTAHAEEKKKGGSHKPQRTYDNNNNNNIWKIADVPSMWGSLRSPNYALTCVIIAIFFFNRLQEWWAGLTSWPALASCSPCWLTTAASLDHLLYGLSR